MSVMKLDPHQVTQLRCPPDKRKIQVCDSELRGLVVEVRALTQGATYYLRYRGTDNKTAYAKLGRTTDISLAEARKKARALKLSISAGADPGGEKKARQAIPTLAAYMRDSYLPHAKVHKKSWQRDEELYRLRIDAAFGHLRLDQISRHQVQLFHSKLLGQVKPATANHHVKLLKHALNLAVEWQMIDRNVLSKLALAPELNQVERYMDEGQLERLLQVLRTDDNRPVCLIALFLLSTGARLNEALQATWKQIDKPNRVWRIPASHSKSQRVRSIPLNDSALEVLAQMDTEGKHENVFIGKRRGTPLTTIMKVWSRLRKLAGLPHLRLHDLRHQYASFLVNSGRTFYEVQQILGHSDSKVTQRYSHLSSKSLQEAANTASVIIKGASTVPVEETGELVPKAA
jgi:integrase